MSRRENKIASCLWGFIRKRVPMKIFHLFFQDEKGGGLVEYVLIITLIVLVCIAGMTTVGTKLNTGITSIANSL